MGHSGRALSRQTDPSPAGHQGRLPAGTHATSGSGIASLQSPARACGKHPNDASAVFAFRRVGGNRCPQIAHCPQFAGSPTGQREQSSRELGGRARSGRDPQPSPVRRRPTSKRRCWGPLAHTTPPCQRTDTGPGAPRASIRPPLARGPRSARRSESHSRPRHNKSTAGEGVPARGRWRCARHIWALRLALAPQP